MDPGAGEASHLTWQADGFECLDNVRARGCQTSHADQTSLKFKENLTSITEKGPPRGSEKVCLYHDFGLNHERMLW